jgi:class 3 adenylate cyclase/tetratricopeptide (TPR) repeat protein
LYLGARRANNNVSPLDRAAPLPADGGAGPPMNSDAAICANCGAENTTGARFCASCGAPLSAREGADGELRKTVTVLFCDVTGSTELAESLDPETVRHVMLRYFDEMAQVIARHEGAIEKYIGDAVMAVFGVPQIHEDDALRAVRAAAEMRGALVELNRELDRSWGITLATRIGINTGEVVAGEPGLDQLLVTGDAVNVAARLEQAAQPGEILVGDTTYGLVRAAVSAEEVGGLELKGKALTVAAWRLLDVVQDSPGWLRRVDSPLVDREEELRLLADVFERVTSSGASHVVTAMGSAGVGKSRLSAELLSRVGGRARVAHGRCLPYGEGITFWPIVGVLRDIAGIEGPDSPSEAEAKVSALVADSPEARLIVERLAPLLGPGAETGIQETFWAVRKLFEHLSAERPLVVVFDDIQWGEPTFLDLLEYLVDWMRSSPVLVICLARPELLDVRPGWTAGKENATLVRIEPLSEADTDGLIRNLVGGTELAGEARARIAELAEGNPLFVEESLRMLVDDGLLEPTEGGWVVQGDLASVSIPPTIHAILTARLERLAPEERAVIERASVIGRVFWWGAVTELSPEELRPRVAGHLQSLMRKELIRPDPGRVGRDDAFGFTHILVRDAAYHELPKSVRADIHDRLAMWIEERTQDRAGEYEEIVGYHLEQAYRSLLELGPPSERTEALGRRGAAPLGSAGDRAYVRGDMPAAVNLLSRAAALLPQNAKERAALLPELAFALLETGNFERLQEVAAETSAAAEASGDSRLQGHAAILAMWLRLFTEPVGWAVEAQRHATMAAAAFREAHDERGLAKASSLLALVHTLRCSFAEAETMWETAADHARRAGDRRDEMESRAWVPLTIWAGPAHIDAGLGRCREVFDRAEGDLKVMSSALMAQGAFLAGLGRFDEARVLLARARALAQEVALTVWEAGPLAQVCGWVETFAGDPAAAEHALRSGYETLTEIGEIAWLSTTAALLAEAVYEQGRLDEAAELTRASEEWAGAEDTYSQAGWRSVRAKILAHDEDHADEAERLARECTDLAEQTDFLHLRWRALMSLAEVLRLGGRAEEAAEALERAVAVAEEKGNSVAAEQARALALHR